MRLRVVERDSADRHELAQGGLLLDQPGSAVVRVVRQPFVAARNRTGRTGWRHGALPGHAHVHHERTAEDRHESSRSAASAGFVASKGNMIIFVY